MSAEAKMVKARLKEMESVIVAFSGGFGQQGIGRYGKVGCFSGKGA